MSFNFNVEFRNEYLIIDCSYDDVMKNAEVETIRKHILEMEQSKLNKIKWVVINIANIESISNNCLPGLCRISSMLATYNINVSTITKNKFAEIIFKQGVDSVLHPFSSFELFLKHFGSNSAPTTEFLNTMLNAVVSTLKIYLESDIKNKSVAQLKQRDQVPKIQVGAVAGILSKYFNGNLTIGFSDEVFRTAMSRFLQMDIEAVTPDILDGAAELLNVIVGQTKIDLNKKGFEVQQVIPSVISGSSFDIFPSSNHSAILINFECDFGDFFVILTTNSKPKASNT